VRLVRAEKIVLKSRHPFFCDDFKLGWLVSAVRALVSAARRLRTDVVRAGTGTALPVQGPAKIRTGSIMRADMR